MTFSSNLLVTIFKKAVDVSTNKL